MRRSLISFFILLGLLLLTFFVVLPVGSVTTDNETLLTAVRHEALEDILLLGEILAFVHIIASADLGVSLIVSANIEVGQAFAALEIGVERALGVAFIASVLSEFWVIVLKLCTVLALPLLRISLALGAFFLLIRALGKWPKIDIIIQHLMQVSLLGLIGVWLIIPYTVSLTGLVALTMTGTEFHMETADKLHTEIITTGAQSDPLSFWHREKNIHTSFADTADNITHKIEKLSEYVIERLVHAAVLGILFPLFLTGFLWFILRRLLYLAMVVEPKTTIAPESHPARVA